MARKSPGTTLTGRYCCWKSAGPALSGFAQRWAAGTATAWSLMPLTLTIRRKRAILIADRPTAANQIFPAITYTRAGVPHVEGRPPFFVDTGPTMNAATRPVTVTIPQWLWVAIGALALMLAGTAVTAVGSMVGRLSEHESRLSRVESSAVTQAQAGAMFGSMRAEIRADIAGVRDEIRGLRQELRQ